MARFDFAKCRRLVPAARQRVGTARVEMAARRRVDLARNVALEDHAFAIPRTVFPSQTYLKFSDHSVSMSLSVG
jgi:hypothetical protein